MQLRKLSHIELPTKREFVKLPCNCKHNPKHGPHYREVIPDGKEKRNA